MSDADVRADRGPTASGEDGFLSPPVCAVTAFTLAVLALIGQNMVTAGVASLLELGPVGGTQGFYLGWGLATLLQVGLVLALALRALRAPGGWDAVLARAAVLVAGVAVLAGALVVVGGLLADGPGGF